MTKWIDGHMNAYYKLLLPETSPEYNINYRAIIVDLPHEIRPITVEEVKETNLQMKNWKSLFTSTHRQ